MRKLLLPLLVLLLAPLAAQADSLSLSSLINGLKMDAGTAWDFKNQKLEQTDTIVLLEYAPSEAPSNPFLKYLAKANPALNVGYSTADKAVVGISIDLGSLSDLGVQVPILKLISFQPTVYYSFYHINLSNPSAIKNSWLLGAKILNVKF